MSFNMIFIGTPIMFPTEVIGTAFGFCRFWAGMVSILAPYLAELHPESISQWIFVGSAILGIFASIALRKPNYNNAI